MVVILIKVIAVPVVVVLVLAAIVAAAATLVLALRVMVVYLYFISSLCMLFECQEHKCMLTVRGTECYCSFNLQVDKPRRNLYV